MDIKPTKYKKLDKKLIISTSILFSIFVNSSNYAGNLLDAYKIAEKSDPKIKQALAEYKAVEKNVPIAVAELLPEIILSAGAEHQRALNFQGDPRVDTTYFSLNLTQSLFEWDKIQRYLQSEIEVEQAIHNLEVAKEDLLIRLSDAYFNILEAEDTLEFISTEKNSVKQLYDEAKERFDVGLIPIADVDEAKARYDVKTADEIQAKNDLDDRYEELKQIIGKEFKNIDILIPNFKPSHPKPNDINKWVKLAEKRNHSLISERLETQIQEKNEDIAFAGHLPSAEFTARYAGIDSNESLQISNISTADGYINSIGASLRGELEIFGGGGTQATVEQARYNAIAAGHNTERVRREVVSDTKQNYRTIISNINQISALEQAEKSSLSSLEATKAGYEIGTRASIDVLDRLTDLYEQKQKLSIARYNYIKNVINLKRNSGILTNKDIEIINKWLVDRGVKKTGLDKYDVKDKVMEDIKKKNGLKKSKQDIEKDNKKETIKNKEPEQSKNINTDQNSSKSLEELKKELQMELEKLDQKSPTQNNQKPAESTSKSPSKSPSKSIDELKEELKDLQDLPEPAPQSQSEIKSEPQSNDTSADKLKSLEEQLNQAPETKPDDTNKNNTNKIEDLKKQLDIIKQSDTPKSNSSSIDTKKDDADIDKLENQLKKQLDDIMKSYGNE